MSFIQKVGAAIKTGAEKIGTAITTAGKAIVNGIGKICGTGGEGLQTIGKGASNIVCAVENSVPVRLSSVKVLAKGVEMVGSVVSGIAELIQLKEPGKQEPSEIGMKAEVCGEDPSVFSSAREYLQHLQDNVTISEQAGGPDIARAAAYIAVGAHIYISAVEEELGLKNGTLSPEALADYVKLKLTPNEIVTQAKELAAEGVGTKEMSDYLHGSTTLEVTEKVDNALERAFKIDDPEMTEEDIAEKILEMRDTVGEDFAIDDEGTEE